MTHSLHALEPPMLCKRCYILLNRKPAHRLAAERHRGVYSILSK